MKIDKKINGVEDDKNQPALRKRKQNHLSPDDESCRMAQSAKRAGDFYPSSFFFKSSLTNCGLAFPWVAFMTWPTKKPNTFSFPFLYSSTSLGFLARISATAFSMADV